MSGQKVRLCLSDKLYGIVPCIKPTFGYGRTFATTALTTRTSNTIQLSSYIEICLFYNPNPNSTMERESTIAEFNTHTHTIIYRVL